MNTEGPELIDASDNNSFEATLLFLASLVNRLGGQVYISTEEIERNLPKSAIRFIVDNDGEGNPTGVTLKTMEHDDAMAYYKEFDLG